MHTMLAGLLPAMLDYSEPPLPAGFIFVRCKRIINPICCFQHKRQTAFRHYYHAVEAKVL